MLNLQEASLAADPSLIDRVVIVTGGSRGIGREIAMTLVEAGAQVAVVGLHDSPQLAKTAQDAKAIPGGGRLIPIVADLRRDADCQRIAAETIKAFGTVHVLFNNAGLGLQVHHDYSKKTPTMFWETDVEAWNALVDTNVHGVCLLSRAVTPTTIAHQHRKIIKAPAN